VKKIYYIFAILILVLLLSFRFNFYFYQKYQTVQKTLQKQKQLNSNDREKLIAEVGKLIELPKEEATVAAVSDKEKLKDQPFFQNAKNGDRVLIFTKAKKAILYRPSIKKIIEVAPINLGSPSANIITPTISSKQLVKLAIYNGTKIRGLAASIKELITDKMIEIEVVTTGNSNNNYTENLIIDLKGGHNNIVNQLTKLLSAKTSSLPEGESSPDTDLLVIIGKE